VNELKCFEENKERNCKQKWPGSQKCERKFCFLGLKVLNSEKFYTLFCIRIAQVTLGKMTTFENNQFSKL